MMRVSGALTLIKAEQAEEGLAKIGGVISTEARDLQGEIVIQDGLDFSDFERSGYFNYEHKAGIENLLGYPTKVIRKGSQTVVEGVLMLDRPKAREVYETAQAMAKSRGLRSLGFSVEGHVTERDENDPKIVKKALVRHCAITSSPINPQTSMELRKSFDQLEVLYKGAVGYQEPAMGGGALAPLVPQQLETGASNAGPMVTDERLARAIRALSVQFPALPVSDLIRAARQLTGVRK